MSKIDYKKGFTNAFGAVGYLSCSLQWLWALLLYFSLIKSLILLININVDANNNAYQPPIVVSNSPNVFIIGLLIFFTVAMLALTIYSFFKIPSTIVNTSKNVVGETAKNLAPLLIRARHEKNTIKRRIKLTARLVIVVKIILVIVPFILVYMSQFLDGQMLDYSVAMIISIWLFGFSIVSFGVQYLLSSVFAIDRRNIW